MLLLLLFVTIVCPMCCFSAEDSLRRVSAPGDIIIGGLFPIHVQTNRSTVPGHVSCMKYDLQMFLRTQVMIFAIQEINQRTPRVLPNLTLGYEIYDTCGDVPFAMGATLQLLMPKSDGQSCSLPGHKHPKTIVPEPHVKVVIGERSSEVSIAVARLFALPSVAQISYGSTSELLSRKLKFPSFLRTISSDAYQTKAIAELVKQFNWEIVAIVGSDDEYGKYGSERLIDNFNAMTNVCIDFKEILPSYFALNMTKSHSHLEKLMWSIKNSPAEAIVLFTKGTNIAIIMEAAIRENLNRTWIASDAWSTSPMISEMQGIQKAGRVFGFISRRNEVPGFNDYVASKLNETTTPFLQHHWIHYPPCTPEMNNMTDCSLTNSQYGSKKCLDPSCTVKYTDQDESYNVYLAVKVIAEGLRSLLKCDSKKCEHDANFTAFELLKEIKQVNFTVNTTSIFFDENGDPSIGYDIVQWNMTESTQRIKTIGQYWPNGNIELPDDLVREMRNVTVTAYNCSKMCDPGSELKQGERCCKTCIPCQEGDFSPRDGMECKRCDANEYASPQRDKCLNKTVDFLTWSDPFIIVLSSFDILGIVATILVAALFTVHRRTPVVKAVGGCLCFVELLSLLVCFCITFMFIGKPCKLYCGAGLPLFGMAFTLCISCILANLLQILVGFNFDQRVGAWLKRLNKPAAVVTLIFGIQLVLCVLWLTLYPSFPDYINTNSNKTLLLVCKTRSFVLFGAMLGYIALLSLVCFLFAFKGKRLPDLYKNASFITIAMLLFLVIWIVFIPIHVRVNKYSGAIEAAAILVSSYSILFCHLVPKCYIMVFRKEINNEKAITEYIRKHYEQKGMTVVTS